MPSSAPDEVATLTASMRTLAVGHGIEIEAPTEPLDGRELLLLIEDLYNRLAARTLQVNPFWRAMVEDPEGVDDRVFFGMCIENYHLLFRESYFDAPALSYPENTRVRFLLNEFYCEEFGHDELLLRALSSVGIAREELFLSVPLAPTMALCNALSFWARHDPLFFFTTLGPLEGRDVEIDSYVVAARARGLPEEFVGPILTHANINKSSEHGLLTRAIFEEVAVVPPGTAARIIQSTGLFMAIYDRFYSGVWHHYRTCTDLLRRVDEI
jgi:hypothetical protein